jgi:flagellar biogenesis protein FliO
MATEIHAQDVIILIFYLVLLVLGAYFLTRYVSKRAMKKGVRKPDNKKTGTKFKWKEGRYISVLDRVPVDRDKSIMVVEFEGKRYLMATTGQDIKLLDKLKKEYAKESEAETEEPGDEPSRPEAYQAQQGREGRFSARFFDSFKVVFKNYYKKDSLPFGVRLQDEIKKTKESGQGDRK